MARFRRAWTLAALAFTGCTSPPTPEPDPEPAPARTALPDPASEPVAGSGIEEPGLRTPEASPARHVTLEAENADVRTVLLDIARQGGGSVILGPEVEGTITVSLHDVPWRDALDAVARTLGYVVVDDSRGRPHVVSGSDDR
jgi:type IV pilus assembly protein PilQ